MNEWLGLAIVTGSFDEKRRERYRVGEQSFKDTVELFKALVTLEHNILMFSIREAL